uniref:Sodium channel modifier 1 n=1 Tax=Anser brachyrhynchus TaxID=132585 RepID=A0A8B9BV83_9AVES
MRWKSRPSWVKRRVAELLANYIPEDEALLLRSGRYACTVCAHRPVFDTLEVLAVHRAGRKHLGSLQRCYGSERWREDAAQEQRHEELVRVEVAAPLLARTRRIAQSALLKAAPYSSCCRRTGKSSVVIASESALSPQPCEAPGAGAVPAAAEVSWALLTREPPASRASRPLSIPSAGWIQDRSGKWVKDENAEFDSDEDEPPALLPA